MLPRRRHTPPLGLVLLGALVGCQAPDTPPATSPRSVAALKPTARPLGEGAPSWRYLESGVSESLRGVSVGPGGIVWASGSHGTFLRSTDAGSTWQSGQVPGAEELDFRDVEAVDVSTAFLLSAGQPGRIYKTEDAGQHWTLLYEDEREGIFFDAMAFFSPRHGLAFSDPVDGRFVVVTTDDGVRWIPTDPDGMPSALPGEAGFAASGTALTVYGERHAWFGTGGPRARVFRSSDGGKTWAVAETPMLAGQPSRGIFSLHFSDPLHGFATGGDYERPDLALANLARTEDGGETWVAAAQLGGFREAIALVPDSGGQRWLAVGPGGLDWSVDGGRSWTSAAVEDLHTLATFADGSGAVLAGAQGRLVRLDWAAALQAPLMGRQPS